MNRRTLFSLLLALASLPAWAIHVECDDFFNQVGVKLGSGQIELTDGQTVEAAVGVPAVLARHGLRATKEGDPMKVTHIRDYRFRLMHIPSGASIEITYKPKK